jgi:hypothetical protein
LRFPLFLPLVARRVIHGLEELRTTRVFGLRRLVAVASVLGGGAVVVVGPNLASDILFTSCNRLFFYTFSHGIMFLFPLLLCFIFGIILLGSANAGWSMSPDPRMNAVLQKDYYFAFVGALIFALSGLWFITVDRKMRDIGRLVTYGSTQAEREEWQMASHSHARQKIVDAVVCLVAAVAFGYFVSVNVNFTVIVALAVVAFIPVPYFFLSRKYYALKDSLTEHTFHEHLMSVLRREIVVGVFLLFVVGTAAAAFADEMFRSNRYGECTAICLFVSVSLVYYSMRMPTTNHLGDSQLVTATFAVICTILSQLQLRTFLFLPSGLEYPSLDTKLQ